MTIYDREMELEPTKVDKKVGRNDYAYVEKHKKCCRKMTSGDD